MLAIKNEKGYLKALLGAFHPNTYFRAIYVPYTKEDIAKLERQFRTGEPVYKRNEYKLASSWKDKERILRVHTTAYHEAFHYFQILITSFGIYDQYVRTGQNTDFLDMLLQHNGLPGRSLHDFVMENLQLFEEGSPLSRGTLLLSGIMEGSRLFLTKKPIPFRENNIFKIIPVPTPSGMDLLQICIEIDGKLYPFGAKVLMESWAFSVMKGAISSAFGNTAAQDYTERLRIPFYPYKILEYLVQLICPSDKLLNNPLFISYIVSFIAYYALNHEPYGPPDSPIGPGFFPGYRAAYLIEMLGDYIRKERSLSHATIYDAWECGLLLDKSKGWNSFITNGYRMQESIETYMSKITGYKKWHLRTFNLGAYAMFMGDAHLAMLETLSDTPIIFEIRRWLQYYANSNLFRPPISLFAKIINGEEVYELKVISNDSQKGAFWSGYYIIASIIEQKINSPTWQCPLGRVGSSACENFDASVCRNQLPSFDLPQEMVKKQCKIVDIVQGMTKAREKRGKGKGHTFIFFEPAGSPQSPPNLNTNRIPKSQVLEGVEKERNEDL